MLIWKGSRGVRFPASHGLRWGGPPASNGTKGARGTPLLQNCPQGPQGAGAANVRAGAERHPVGWVPALPAGFLSNVKPRDVQEVRCNAKRAGSTCRVQGEACGLNLPATADVSSAMGLTRRLAAEVVLAGLVYRRRERGKRRQSP